MSSLQIPGEQLPDLQALKTSGLGRVTTTRRCFDSIGHGNMTILGWVVYCLVGIYLRILKASNKRHPVQWSKFSDGTACK